MRRVVTTFLIAFFLVNSLQFIPSVKATANITYSIIGFSSATNGTSCIFRVKWNATGSHYIFGTNNTGSWVNETATAFSGVWTNTTKTLTATIDAIVQWRYWVNDTGGQWTSIPLQSLTTVNVYSYGAVTGEPSNLQTAVDNVTAQGGGNVYVPAGTFNYNLSTATDQIEVTNQMNIFGAGSTNTILKCTSPFPWSYQFFSVDTGNGLTDTQVRISGIHFEGGSITVNDDGAGSAIYIYRSIDFRIDHSSFNNFPNTAITVGNVYTTYIQPRGVIDHNTFNNTYKYTYDGLWGYGIIMYGPITIGTEWSSEINDITNLLGQYETITSLGKIPVAYIEDNTFQNMRHTPDASQGGWFVSRYNNYLGGQYVFADSNHAGSRGQEVYKNTFNLTDGSRAENHAIGFRGGGGVAWNNTISDTDDSGIVIKWEESNYDQKEPHNIWIWDNTFLNVSPEVEVVNNAYSNITLNTDYFLRAPTLAQDGFTYTPYPYPHPLVGEPEAPPQYAAPQYFSPSVSTDRAGVLATFLLKWASASALSKGVLSHNKTGSYVNVTQTMSGADFTYNYTIELPDTIGTKVQYKFYANDTSNRWNQTSWYILTTTAFPSNPTIYSITYFGFGTGVYVHFDTQRTFSTITKTDGYWYFDGYGFQVQNANMTIGTFFVNNQLIFTVSATSGITSTTQVYCGVKGEPISVSGATSHSYNALTQIETITVLHSSNKTVVLDWSPLGPPPEPTPNYYHLNVQVTNSKGILQSDAKVTVWTLLGVAIQSQTTSNLGSASFRLSPSTYMVTAEKEGIAIEKVTVNQDKTITLTIGAPSTIRPFSTFTQPFTESVPSLIGISAYIFLATTGGFILLGIATIITILAFLLDKKWLLATAIPLATLGILVVISVYITPIF